ncbi:unnamed protein product [Amoebophrya sp. A120]|nr:unnamed protein product [Amoebophrya sp. A120]|eukprot:GSA120T00002597001.1
MRSFLPKPVGGCLALQVRAEDLNAAMTDPAEGEFDIKGGGGERAPKNSARKHGCRSRSWRRGRIRHQRNCTAPRTRLLSTFLPKSSRTKRG